MTRILDALLWSAGLIVAFSCLVAAWVLTDGNMSSSEQSPSVDFAIYTASILPLYLMIFGLWPNKWNVVLKSIRRIFARQWRMVVLDWLIVATLYTYPALGLLFAIADDSFLPQLHAWLWMTAAGSVVLTKRPELGEYMGRGDG